jgi:hypothetical protein
MGAIIWKRDRAALSRSARYRGGISKDDSVFTMQRQFTGARYYLVHVFPKGAGTHSNVEKSSFIIDLRDGSVVSAIYDLPLGYRVVDRNHVVYSIATGGLNEIGH